VCTGAFALAEAGLLAGRRCTTHWKVVDRMQRRFPATKVVANRLFVRDGNLITSAGVASGIDMALALVEEDHGPLLVARVAREMVVYVRRNGEETPHSITSITVRTCTPACTGSIPMALIRSPS